MNRRERLRAELEGAVYHALAADECALVRNLIDENDAALEQLALANQGIGEAANLIKALRHELELEREENERLRIELAKPAGKRGI